MTPDVFENFCIPDTNLITLQNSAKCNGLKEPIGFLVYNQLKRSTKKKISIYTGKDVLVGRDATKWYETCWIYLRRINLCFRSECYINDDYISKLHFRIYSVIYEQNKKSNLQPLIYCEDLESTNGTYINGYCIGRIGHERTGYLLSNGDQIEIRPRWHFRFYQPSHPSMILDKKKLEELKVCEDRYSVSDRVLAKGHYGAVFLAKEKSTSRQLACKIVELDKAADEITKTIQPNLINQRWMNNFDRDRDGKKLVLREINILSKLSHPHIINLKDAFYSDTNLYIFTELAPAGDLFSFIESHGGFLTDLHSRVISRQLVLAIKYLHFQGVVHRDIKPENVLIMQTDFGSRVVLTDFGFANKINLGHGRLKSRLGTEGFIAPEVEFLNPFDKGYTMSADLWSLGVLTACLLTGSALIPTNDISQLSRHQIANHFNGVRENRIAKRWQSMRSTALQFIKGLLAMVPAQRMSASEALHHPWYTMPATEAAMIEIGHQRVIRSWERRSGDVVLKKIATHSVSVTSGSNNDYKFMEVPDTTLSPFFSLNRHLKEKNTLKPSHTLKKS
ncbi:Meiosis-specific serine/threonine-protein kinase mek1 [Erysiphe neolycopersici]|uniref:Meiosis-specific serine/threonine-protein kinase mek1 n=1 Tax=Erysiphe neolycopersici TaxID=212602 RepID=A0A420H7X2_9PEZI|nr:Meiosis-specific serine/threonine-protein kinase mek1 [Erysiphe neolycopersici]